MYQEKLLNYENEARQSIYIELKKFKENYGELYADVFMDFREKFMKAYNESKGFSDLKKEIGEAISPRYGKTVEDRFRAMKEAIVSPI